MNLPVHGDFSVIKPIRCGIYTRMRTSVLNPGGSFIVAVYYVYILENPAGRFYTGSTGDVARRVAEHNDAGGGHCSCYCKSTPADTTATRKPVMMSYSFRLSYAQCSNACLCTGRHEKSPGVQFRCTCAM